MKNKKLVIVGVGETAELAAHYFDTDSEYDVVGFAADSEYIKSEFLLGLPIVSIDSLKNNYNPDFYEVFVAVSSTKLNRIRTDLYSRVKNLGYRCATYISSNAYLGYGTKVGENCFILENNVIQPFVTIGDNVVLWSGNHIGHRSIVDDNCFISSHVVISGFCHIGQNTFIGVNSSIADNVRVGRDCLIGIGCIIGKDVDDDSIMKQPYAREYIIKSKQFFNIEE